MQRSDHANVGCAVIFLHFFMAEMPFEKYNRLPGSALEAPINAVSFRLHFSEQIVVTLDVSAAGRSDLNEGESVLINRMLLE